jgi:hypothetical protein
MRLVEVEVTRAPIDARQEHATAPLERKLDQRCGVELFPHRCVNCDTLAGTQSECTIDVTRDEARGVLTLFGG